MARKARKKKRGGFKLFLLSLFFILLIWIAAFLVWFFWSDIRKLTGVGAKKNIADQPQKSSHEKISEEERKKLNEILKRRQ